VVELRALLAHAHQQAAQTPPQGRKKLIAGGGVEEVGATPSTSR
jgi:hypothetical protein